MSLAFPSYSPTKWPDNPLQLCQLGKAFSICPEQGSSSHLLSCEMSLLFCHGSPIFDTTSIKIWGQMKYGVMLFEKRCSLFSMNFLGFFFKQLLFSLPTPYFPLKKFALFLCSSTCLRISTTQSCPRVSQAESVLVERAQRKVNRERAGLSLSKKRSVLCKNHEAYRRNIHINHKKDSL